MRVTFLRHAESEFNADATSTSLDCGLSCTGREQAAAWNGYWSLVIVSPLMRARQTLALSSICYDDMQVCSLVREQRTDPCDFLCDEDSTQLESDEQLMDRADTFLVHLTSLSALHQDILVISHCEFIHAITAQSLHNACSTTLVL